MPSSAEPSPAAQLADTWDDLLGLDRCRRTERQVYDDWEELLQIATEVLHGVLGDPDQVAEALTTIAHQIGKRRPQPERPMAMFKHEVFKIRTRRKIPADLGAVDVRGSENLGAP